MLRDVNLLEYIPPYLKEYRDIAEICAVEDPEIQMVEDETEIIKENQFIFFCNEDGIARWEELLSITPSPDDSLEQRIFRVYLKWSDWAPYTYSVLIEKLNGMIGEENYKLVPNFHLYELGIELTLEKGWMVVEIIAFLREFIPANLKITAMNKWETALEGEIFTAPVRGVVYHSTTLLSPSKGGDL